MPYTKSPLRYPGGKSQLSKFIQHTIKFNDIKNVTYCEAFCGGSGVAMALLFNQTITHAILNDLDPAIFSIWNAILTETDRFTNAIQNIPITLNEWHHQKNIYIDLKNISGYSFDLALAAFFLNRTNRSGIIEGGPIGGYKQDSKYKLNCRFNVQNLINKINKIASYRNQITLYNMDGIQFIQNIITPMPDNNLFIFCDPPYYNQGENLYKNSLDDTYHQNLSYSIQQLNHKYWIVTYDDVTRIRNLYDFTNGQKYDIRYSANAKRKETELLFCSPITQVESFDKVIFSNV